MIRAKQQFPEEYIHPKGINYNLNLQFAFIPGKPRFHTISARVPIEQSRHRPLKRLIKAARNRATSEL